MCITILSQAMKLLVPKPKSQRKKYKVSKNEGVTLKWYKKAEHKTLKLGYEL